MATHGSHSIKRVRYADKAQGTKQTGQPILCTSQFGTCELESGFAPEKVINIAQHAHFICHICKGFPRYPVELKKCGHIYCRFCIFRVLREQNLRCFAMVNAPCPLCKGEFGSSDVLDIKKTSVCLYNLYNSTDIRCTYGCTRICSPSAMMEHETWVCRRRPVLCPHSNCTYQAPDEDMDQHLEQCPRRIIYCHKCRLPKRASVEHDCSAALTTTINLLADDRLSRIFSVDKIFGLPGTTHYGADDDIGTHRINDEEKESREESVDADDERSDDLD